MILRKLLCKKTNAIIHIRMEMSEGRATCSVRNKEQYRDVDNCKCYPNITQGRRVVASDFLTVSERQIMQAANAISQETLRRNLRRRNLRGRNKF